MESRPNNQSESLNRINTPAGEDKETKTKRRYYGQILVIIITFLIIFQYYVFTYQIMWKVMSSKLIILI